MDEKHRVLLVEDHPVFRDGLLSLVNSSGVLEVIGEAEDGEAALRFAEELSPDLILMDLSLPGMSGIEVIRAIKTRQPEVKVLALTVHVDEEYIQAAFQAGADGYVAKDANRQEILNAMEAVLSGKTYLSPGISDRVIKGFLRGAPHSFADRREATSPEPDSVLTLRETEVLTLIASGHTNKAIGELLFISVKTVEKHRANLMAKLDLHTPQALTAYAFERGLLGKS
ncbi:MAG: response regulator [Syntrophobacteraceae bacterium]